MRPGLWRWFSLVQVAACAFVFRDALWVESLLAPLDIAPALFSKYRFLDPASDGVPANHHIIDQLTYDLPLQQVIHEAYRRGEIPWWDPYTLGGRPLLADAHISGTDPVRWTVYHLLPFETAYNWTRVLHSLLTGLGMLLLLRYLGVGESAALLLSLSYQFAGAFAIFFGHPWIQASFLYYPFLWLVWEKCLSGRVWMAGVAALLVGAILYSGNLQSHSYLALFGFWFAIGHVVANSHSWRRVAGVLAGTGLLGALLAAPVLVAQLELFFLNVRPVSAPFDPRGYLAGPASLVAAYPWAFGSFRTLDLSKLFGQASQLGFNLYIGSAGFFLAVVGMIATPSRGDQRRAKLASVCLVASYLIIISTPLRSYLYTRCAPLALIGMIILAGLGWQCLIENSVAWKGCGATAAALAVVAAVGTNVFAVFVYPSLQSKVRTYVERAAAGSSLDEAGALREFQVRNLPAEISFQNPETWLGCAALLGVGGWLCFPAVRRFPGAGVALLTLNLFPLLLFSQRAVPRQKMSLWDRLRSGGAEQRRVMEVTGERQLRLRERAPGLHEQLFPNAMSALYRVRTVHGYAALQPRNLHSLPPGLLDHLGPKVADWIYESSVRGLAAGELRAYSGPGLSRFQWTAPNPRRIEIVQSSLNHIELSFSSGPSGKLLWTDTAYPGWDAKLDTVAVPLGPVPPCFQEIAVSGAAQRLTLDYAPRYLNLGKFLSLGSLLIILALSTSARIHSRARHQSSNTSTGGVPA